MLKALGELVASGVARYGDRCRYSHENGASSAAGSGEKKLCRDFLKGNCKHLAGTWEVAHAPSSTV